MSKRRKNNNQSQDLLNFEQNMNKDLIDKQVIPPDMIQRKKDQNKLLLEQLRKQTLKMLKISQSVKDLNQF